MYYSITQFEGIQRSILMADHTSKRIAQKSYVKPANLNTVKFVLHTSVQANVQITTLTSSLHKK